MACIPQLREHIRELKKDLNSAREQLNIYRYIKEGTIIYAEQLYIHVAQSGVGDWLSSHKPALLIYKDWTYAYNGFALNFDVIASEDSTPYNPPYQFKFSGNQAQIRGPDYKFAKKIKIVPLNDLPLYICFQHKTILFDKLLKGK